MKTVAIIQARMGSTRLPGKVLLPIYKHHNSIQMLCTRLARCKNLDKIVIASTTDPQNKAIKTRTFEHIPVYYGSEEDVLGRVTEVAIAEEADIVVDITADCPFVDPAHVDRLIDRIHIFNGISQGCSYSSNITPRLWPDGFDVQVYTRDMLEMVDDIVWKKEHRTHSGWNIFKYRNLYHHMMVHLGSIPNPNLWCSEWRLTLDTPTDYEIIKEIAAKVNNIHASANEIMMAIRNNPDLLSKVQENM